MGEKLEISYAPEYGKPFKLRLYVPQSCAISIAHPKFARIGTLDWLDLPSGLGRKKTGDTFPVEWSHVRDVRFCRFADACDTSFSLSLGAGCVYGRKLIVHPAT